MGLYIICGKTPKSDGADIVHYLVAGIGRKVCPFAEIVTMNGADVSDSTMPALIFRDIL